MPSIGNIETKKDKNVAETKNTGINLTMSYGYGRKVYPVPCTRRCAENLTASMSLVLQAPHSCITTDYAPLESHVVVNAGAYNTSHEQ